MNYNDYIITLAWPEALTKTANGPYDKILTAFNIHKNGYYKTGHAAFLLIDGETGEIEYFDFGRYISPFKNGRIRSSATDPELKLNYKATFRNKKIDNLNSILLEISNNIETHGTGTLYAGELSQVNKRKAIAYINKQQKKPYIPYGPFHIGGTNCSRFVAQTIQHSVRKGGLKFLYPMYGTPSPLGNVFNTDAKNYYKVQDSELEMHVKPNRFQQLKMILSILTFTVNDTPPKPLRSTLINTPKKGKEIPTNAQWLTGTGAGAWYSIQAIHNQNILVSRHQDNGKQDFELTFKANAMIINPDQDYQFTYPSHALEINITQNGKTLQFSRVLE